MATELRITPSVEIVGKKLKRGSNDLRTRIKVPGRYLSNDKVRGLQNELVGRIKPQGGNSVAANYGYIYFPYTPAISYEYKAEYSALQPTHSNYAQNFYRNSSVGAIQIQGKFTVQNDYDAGVYIASTTLLKALTKMRFGTDQDAGAPPPVCRLFAYGNFMLDNIPIVIQSFRVEFPDSVDYYQLGGKKINLEENPYLGPVAVPTISTINISCLPMFSREEMLSTGYKEFLQGVGVL